MSDLIGYLIERVVQGIAEGSRQGDGQSGAPAASPSLRRPEGDTRAGRRSARDARAAARAQSRFGRAEMMQALVPPTNDAAQAQGPAPGATIQSPGVGVDSLGGGAPEQPLPALPEDTAPPVAALIRSAQGLRAAIVAAEILGRPLALREGEPSGGLSAF